QPFGATASAPMASEDSPLLSISGRQAAPAFVDFHTPPCADAAYNVAALLGSNAIALTRPVAWRELPSGPILTQRSPLSRVVNLNSVTLSAGKSTLMWYVPTRSAFSVGVSASEPTRWAVMSDMTPFASSKDPVQLYGNVEKTVLQLASR